VNILNKAWWQQDIGSREPVPTAGSSLLSPIWAWYMRRSLAGKIVIPILAVSLLGVPFQKTPPVRELTPQEIEVVRIAAQFVRDSGWQCDTFNPRSSINRISQTVWLTCDDGRNRYRVYVQGGRAFVDVL
jgi:hypothetical protein